MSKKEIIGKIIQVEGGYVDDPDDSGGETNFGITVEVARENGYAGPMIDMDLGVAVSIYEALYWDKLELDVIHHQAPAIAEELMDTGVNMGTARAAKFLQRSLNVLNKKGASYPDITVDGGIGQQTIQCFNSCLDIRGPRGATVLLRMLNALQGAFYVELAERRERDEKFIFGWFLNRVS